MNLLASSFFICLMAITTWSQRLSAQFVIPDLASPVVDEGNMISARDKQFLRDLIVRFKEKHQAQIQVLTVKTLSGIPIEQASIQVTDQWKLGDKKRDDGVLLLVAAQERKIRIEVGQGLEGVIPDVKAKRIIADVMVPLFRQSGPSQGIVMGVYQILKLIDPQFADSELGETGNETSFQEDKQTLFQKYQNLFILLFVILIIILNNLRPGGGRRFYGGGWGGGGFGGGFGGGSGGGGWSGGGGGFSGGGSSGDW